MTENLIQQQIVMYFTNNFCLKHHDNRAMIFAVPNGGTRNKIEAITMKRTGTLAGVSDLIVVMHGIIIFVEVKTEFGTLSPRQKDFQNRIESLGYHYIVVRSVEDFKEKVLQLQKKVIS